MGQLPQCSGRTVVEICGIVVISPFVTTLVQNSAPIAAVA
jgi:hypothetical protein